MNEQYRTTTPPGTEVPPVTEWSDMATKTLKPHDSTTEVPGSVDMRTTIPDDELGERIETRFVHRIISEPTESTVEPPTTKPE